MYPFSLPQPEALYLSVVIAVALVHLVHRFIPLLVWCSTIYTTPWTIRAARKQIPEEQQVCYLNSFESYQKIPIHWWEIRRMWCASGGQKTLNLPVHAWWLRLIRDSGISFCHLPWTHCIDLIVKLPTAKDFPVKVTARFFYLFQFHLRLPCFLTAPAKTFSTAL